MSDSQTSDLDLQTKALCEASDFAAAATLILSSLGPDLVRVIHARFRDEDATGEVFSRFAQDLWMGLPSFGFRCSVRAYCFTLARNAGSRFLKREVQRQRAGVPLSLVPELAQQAAALRSTTLAHLRSDNRDRVARLRESLSEDEQLLLTLRVDRNLDWREIAIVMLGSPDAEAAAVTTEAARLRKRFQLLKDKLRRLVDASD